MTHESDDYRFTRARGTADSFRDWLMRRPTESWLFLAAGLVLGTIIG